MQTLHWCRNSPPPGEIPETLVPDGYEVVVLNDEGREVRVPKMRTIKSKWMPRLEGPNGTTRLCGYHAQSLDRACEGCPKRASE